LNVGSSPASVSAITPNFVSPVLKSFVVISLSGFSGTLAAEDFSVTLKDQNTTSGVASKQVNVVSVDNTAKTLTTKYGGIYSGTYNVEVVHSSFGKLDSTSVSL
jgi:hypothetical protein